MTKKTELIRWIIPTIKSIEKIVIKVSNESVVSFALNMAKDVTTKIKTSIKKLKIFTAVKNQTIKFLFILIVFSCGWIAWGFFDSR